MHKLSKFNEYTSQLYEDLNPNKPKKNGIECDNCDQELYDSNPMQILTSLPSKKAVHCLSCGFTGYRNA